MSAHLQDAPDAPAVMLDAESIRRDFPILQQQVHGHPLVYLDNAASTQKPRAVIEAMDAYYSRDNANVHRGIHELSNRASEAYDGARGAVARFFGIADEAELIWTRGTTEALNLVAYTWGLDNLRRATRSCLRCWSTTPTWCPGSSWRSGPVPACASWTSTTRAAWTSPAWTISSRSGRAGLRHPRLQRAGDAQPGAEIAARAHAVGAVVVVDGAQSAPHLPVDVSALGCDFYAFSGHKMCGPTGMGGLWGRRALLEAMPPFHGGGDMIEWVELERSTYAPLPNKFEAGTPNIAGAVGMRAAVEYLEAIGRDAILAHERALLSVRRRAPGRDPGSGRCWARATFRSAPAWSPSRWPTSTRTTWPPSWTPRAWRSAPATTARSR
jgi:cysteine desulfurase / selenocysteine lyase